MVHLNMKREQLLRLLVIGGALCLIFWAASRGLVRWYLEPELEEQIKKWVHDQSEDRFSITFTSLGIGLWNQSVSLENVALQRNKETIAYTPLQVPRIVIENFGIWSYLRRGNLQVGTVSIINPFLELRMGEWRQLTENFQTSIHEDSGSNLEPKRYWRVEKFRIRGARAKVMSEDWEEKGTFREVHMSISGLRQNDTSKVSFPIPLFDGLDFQMGTFTYHLSGHPYTLEVGSSRCTSKQKSCEWKELSLNPRLPKQEFARKVGYETDRMVLDISRIKLSGVDFDRLIEPGIMADRLAVQQADLEIFRDKTLAEPTEPRMFPHQSIKKLPVPVQLDTISVHKTDLQYMEQKAGLSKPGRVTFDNVRASLYGITNNPDMISQGHALEMDIKTEVMGTGALTLRGIFPLYKEGDHQLCGTLAQMDMRDLNPVFEPLELIRIKSGDIRSLDFEINLGPESSSGEVQFAYDDLSVELLDKEDIGKSGHRTFVSFLANNLKVKSSNTDPLRKGEISFQRVKHKSVFNYWWKSLASGLKGSIGM